MRRAILLSLLAACSSKAPMYPSSPPDPQTNIILVAVGPSHGPGEHEYYAGSLILAGLLAQNPGAVPAVVPGGFPADTSVFDNARAIVFFTDGNAYHPLLAEGRLDALAPHVARGVGLGSLHWAVHFPGTPDPRVLEWWGAHYSDAISVNPVWTARYADLPQHPALEGVTPFELQDEWYYNLAFAPNGVTSILHAVPPDSTRFTSDAASHPGRAETTLWAYEREDGGRAFGFTGGHFHRNWGDEAFRRAAVNAILWIAKLDIPAGGAKVDLDPAALDDNLDPK